MTTIQIDPERCQGHGRCYDLAPDLFGADDEGYGQVLGDGLVSPGREQEARLAAANRPASAAAGPRPASSAARAWPADPFPIQDDLRQRCPVAHTERFGGAWLPTRYDDVASIAYDTGRFSSRALVISNFRPSPDLAPVGGTPPISSDPPFHHDARKLLLPAFTKTAISRYEESPRPS